MSEIKVVPCRYRHYPEFAESCHILVDGKPLQNKTQNGYWCGTEAEALEKAAELRGEVTISETISKEEALKRYPESAEKIHAAVETRPPAPTPFIQKSYCSACDKDILIPPGCPHVRLAEQAAPPRPLTSAELKERTKQDADRCNDCACRWTDDGRHSYNKQCPCACHRCKHCGYLRAGCYCANGFASAAPAAIEQARPQPPDSFADLRHQIGYPKPAAAAEPAPERDWAYSAAEKIHALFNNASYFSTRNAEHRKQMMDGWAEIIRAARAVAVPEPAAQQESPWMLMTCAPKDGTHILASEGATGRGFGVCGGRTQPFAAVVHWWDGEDEGWYLSSGSCDQPLTGLVRWQYFDRAEASSLGTKEE